MVLGHSQLLQVSPFLDTPIKKTDKEGKYADGGGKEDREDRRYDSDSTEGVNLSSGNTKYSSAQCRK